MPITATYSKGIFIQAASDETLTGAQAKAVIAAMPAGWLPTLVNHVNDPTAQGATLADWKTAFPTILGSLTDQNASFLIRVAVAAAGGVAV